MLIDESVFHFDDFCAQVLFELDRVEPYWRGYLEVDEVVDWLYENWVPTVSAGDPSAVALRCLAELEQAQIEAFAAAV